MRAPQPPPTDTRGRRGALANALLALAAIVVLIMIHAVAACCPDTAPDSHHADIALATAAGSAAPVQVTGADCDPTATWTAQAVLSGADPSHAPPPALLHVLPAALLSTPVAVGFLRHGGPRAPPSHSRRLASLCVLRT